MEEPKPMGDLRGELDKYSLLSPIVGKSWIEFDVIDINEVYKILTEDEKDTE